MPSALELSDLAGLPDEVSDHYLRKQRTDMEWVREAMHTQLRLTEWGLYKSDARSGPPDALHAIRDVVLPFWAKKQCEFFTKATARDHLKLARREDWERRLPLCGMAAGALVLFHRCSLLRNTR